MAKKQRRTWVYSPRKQPGPKVPDNVKLEVEQDASELIEKVLKPAHIKPPPKDMQFNYLVDIFTKWYKNYFYFCGKYNSPGPYAISPSFETKFTRMEYRGPSRFNLAYLRHTGEWIEIYRDLSLKECLKAIQEDPWFQP
jgi:hypothetical protein